MKRWILVFSTVPALTAVAWSAPGGGQKQYVEWLLNLLCGTKQARVGKTSDGVHSTVEGRAA